jgi:hypothetical protein
MKPLNTWITIALTSIIMIGCSTLTPAKSVCVPPELAGPYVVSQEINDAEIKSFVLSQRDWLELSRYLKCEKGTPENLSPTVAD